MRTAEEIQQDLEVLDGAPSYYGNEWKKPKREQLKSEILDAITTGIPLPRLREICEAERDGRCMVLPQRGDKLFYAPYPSGAKGQDGEPMFLRNTGDGSGIVERVAVHVYFNNWSRPVPLKKTWKTRAEAETAKGEAE